MAAGAEYDICRLTARTGGRLRSAFSELKAHLRKIPGRSAAGLMRVLKACAGLVKPAECESYFTVCGYDTT